MAASRVTARECMNSWWDTPAYSTEQLDLTAQRDGLHALGVGEDRV